MRVRRRSKHVARMEQARTVSVVARLPKALSHCGLVQRQCHCHATAQPVVDRVMQGVTPCHKGGARRTAHILYVILVEHDAIGSERVDGRRVDLL